MKIYQLQSSLCKKYLSWFFLFPKSLFSFPSSFNFLSSLSKASYLKGRIQFFLFLLSFLLKNLTQALKCLKPDRVFN